MFKYRQWAFHVLTMQVILCVRYYRHTLYVGVEAHALIVILSALRLDCESHVSCADHTDLSKRISLMSCIACLDHADRRAYTECFIHCMLPMAVRGFRRSTRTTFEKLCQTGHLMVLL